MTVVLIVFFALLLVNLILRGIIVAVDGLHWLCMPLFLLHGFLTNTLPESRNGNRFEGTIQYDSIPQLIIFGFFGNIVYYALITGIILSMLYVRWDGNEYLTKQLTYSTGDYVYTKDKTYGTVEGTVENGMKTPWYKAYAVNDHAYKAKELSLAHAKADNKFWALECIQTGLQHTKDSFLQRVTFYRTCITTGSADEASSAAQ